jgi:hypothetical protein
MEFTTLNPDISRAYKDKAGKTHIVTGSTNPVAAINQFQDDLEKIGITTFDVRTDGPSIEVILSVRDASKFETHWKAKGGGAIPVADIPPTRLR